MNVVERSLHVGKPAARKTSVLYLYVMLCIAVVTDHWCPLCRHKTGYMDCGHNTANPFINSHCEFYTDSS